MWMFSPTIGSVRMLSMTGWMAEESLLYISRLEIPNWNSSQTVVMSSSVSDNTLEIEGFLWALCNFGFFASDFKTRTISSYGSFCLFSFNYFWDILIETFYLIWQYFCLPQLQEYSHQIFAEIFPHFEWVTYEEFWSWNCPWNVIKR